MVALSRQSGLRGLICRFGGVVVAGGRAALDMT
jgi:hypothetical protein